MKVKSVGIKPTSSQREIRHCMMPEMLAAVGARYSRSNEGLDEIFSKVDGDSEEASIDSIFKMVDYGHQSIADLSPVAMFMDDISIWLAYYIWSICPTASGQETSTRYVELDYSNLNPEEYGIPKKDHWQWKDFIGQSFEDYKSALEIWKTIAIVNPEKTGIPQSVMNDMSESGTKKRERMKRNFAFDRSRYWLPVAAKTNMMLIMSARGWVNLCQHLLSHYWVEANDLGRQIKLELSLVAPRMVKHAEVKDSFYRGIRQELNDFSFEARNVELDDLEDACFLELSPLDYSKEGHNEESRQACINSLKSRRNRYDYMVNDIKRRHVSFGWYNIALAEVRDLNRHRTGNKYLSLVPLKFYGAKDQLIAYEDGYQQLLDRGQKATERACKFLAGHNESFPYWTNLGSTYYFEHTTSLDKFIYEAELRTGIGSHYRYANHMRDVLQLLYEEEPSMEGLILEGEAEPE